MLAVLLSNTPAQGQTEGRPPLKVVQLGDSYSAGNGARTDDGGRNYVGPSDCYRSPFNWGNQFVQGLRSTFAVTYINRACSGGVAAEILEPREMGSITRLPFTSCPSASYPDDEYWEQDDSGFLDRCIRFMKPQIEAVDTSVDLVLMTIGGNDVQFTEIVKQCFVRGFRDVEDCRNRVDAATGALAALEERITNVLAELRARMRPDAKVVLVGYPHLINDINYQLENNGERYDAAAAVRQLALSGDVRQARAVLNANNAAGTEFAYFVNIKGLFADHAPSPAGVDTNDDQWLHSAFSTRLRPEWYHYNGDGHRSLSIDLGLNGGFEFGENPPESTSDIDVVFVVDTTGSMVGEIAQVRTDLAQLVADLAASTNSYRIGVVSYRDFPERTGSAADYSSRTDLPLTDDLGSIQAAIDGLDASGGGDFPESVFSGIDTALDQNWRPGVSKVALVVGDAPPLSPEPVSGLTTGSLIGKSLAIDPVQIVGVDVGSLDSGGDLSVLAEGTGGSVEIGTADLTGTISEILGAAAQEPFAWIAGPLAGAIGDTIELDASGSFDPSGEAITGYEWDFDGDGAFDAETSDPTTTTTYDAAFDGVVVVRVTGPGGTALGSTRIVVNETGSSEQGTNEPCELDELLRPIITDERGNWIDCEGELPTEDLPGVTVITDETEEAAGVFFSTNTADAMRLDSIEFGAEDVVFHETETGEYSMVFDGSDVGTSSDLDAFARLGDGSLLMSFAQPQQLDGLGRVEDADVVRFFPDELGDQTSGRFELYLDGSDVGLTTGAEDIDALAVTDDGQLVVSTLGNARTGDLDVGPDDLIVLIDAVLGADSAGTWMPYLLNDESRPVGTDRIDAASIGAAGVVHVSTRGSASPNAEGQILRCESAEAGISLNCETDTTWANLPLRSLDALEIRGS